MLALFLVCASFAAGCTLLSGHIGPHQFTCVDGKTYEWQTDLGCTCEHCEQLEGDYCIDYWPV